MRNAKYKVTDITAQCTAWNTQDRKINCVGDFSECSWFSCTQKNLGHIWKKNHWLSSCSKTKKKEKKTPQKKPPKRLGSYYFYIIQKLAKIQYFAEQTVQCAPCLKHLTSSFVIHVAYLNCLIFFNIILFTVVFRKNIFNNWIELGGGKG